MATLPSLLHSGVPVHCGPGKPAAGIGNCWNCRCRVGRSGRDRTRSTDRVAGADANAFRSLEIGAPDMVSFGFVSGSSRRGTPASSVARLVWPAVPADPGAFRNGGDRHSARTDAARSQSAGRPSACGRLWRKRTLLNLPRARSVRCGALTRAGSDGAEHTRADRRERPCAAGLSAATNARRGCPAARPIKSRPLRSRGSGKPGCAGAGNRCHIRRSARLDQARQRTAALRRAVHSRSVCLCRAPGDQQEQRHCDERRR